MALGQQTGVAVPQIDLTLEIPRKDQFFIPSSPFILIVGLVLDVVHWTSSRHFNGAEMCKDAAYGGAPWCFV